jgi:hypothetical protein
MAQSHETVLMGVETREHAGSAGGALRGCSEVAVETNAPLGQCVYVGTGHVRVAVATEEVAEIVGQKHEDVGSRHGGSLINRACSML